MTLIVWAPLSNSKSNWSATRFKSATNGTQNFLTASKNLLKLSTPKLKQMNKHLSKFLTQIWLCFSNKNISRRLSCCKSNSKRILYYIIDGRRNSQVKYFWIQLQKSQWIQFSNKVNSKMKETKKMRIVIFQSKSVLSVIEIKIATIVLAKNKIHNNCSSSSNMTLTASKEIIMESLQQL